MVKELFSILVACFILLIVIVFGKQVKEKFAEYKKKRTSEQNDEIKGIKQNDEIKGIKQEKSAFFSSFVNDLKDFKAFIIHDIIEAHKQFITFLLKYIFTVILIGILVLLFITDLHALFTYGEYEYNKWTFTPVEYEMIRWVLVFILFSIIMLLRLKPKD